MMMKKYASLLFALVLALSLSVSAAAGSSGVYVYDDAALLTQEEYDTPVSYTHLTLPTIA